MSEESEQKHLMYYGFGADWIVFKDDWFKQFSSITINDIDPTQLVIPEDFEMTIPIIILPAGDAYTMKTPDYITHHLAKGFGLHKYEDYKGVRGY